MILRPSLLAALIAPAFFNGCGGRGRARPVRPIPAPASVGFQDVSSEAGIDFTQGHAGRSPLTILETGGGGCGFLDYDGDGRLDLFLVGQPRCALYRNLGGGRFTDVTRAMGLTAPGRWIGCAVADYDGDGYPDLFLTGYRCAALLHNERGGRFRDVTQAAGLKSDLWTTSAEFADVDGDGYPDLYVGAYVHYQRGTEDLCRLGSMLSACGPEHYEPERGRLYRNLGNGRFDDVTAKAGLGQASGKTWGVAFGDYDDDGRPDLYLANDMTPCNLYHNLGHGRFEEVGMASGTAYDPGGRVMGAMGVDWGDFNGDGKLDLFVGTYFLQGDALFQNQDGHAFRQVSDEAGISLPTQRYVAFGGGFLDADNDGDLDLFVTNGHVRDNVSRFDSSQEYPQPMQLFLNRGDGSYADASSRAGEAFSRRLVGRGAAFGDYDGDGRLDILAVDLEGKARLLRNVSTAANHWLELRLSGRGANREALGARVTVTAGGRRQVRFVKRGGSVLSAHDSLVHLGLGQAASVERLDVRWPDGSAGVWRNLRSDRRYRLKQETPPGPSTHAENF